MERRRAYPSDIGREQSEAIRPILEGVRRRTKPRTVDFHAAFNAVLHVLKSGCQWRMLPEGFSHWVAVYSYFATWSAPQADRVSALEQALEKNRLARP